MKVYILYEGRRCQSKCAELNTPSLRNSIPVSLSSISTFLQCFDLIAETFTGGYPLQCGVGTFMESWREKCQWSW